MRDAQSDIICKNCWNKAVECFGTSKIFQARARWYRRWLNIVSYLGVGVPALVGIAILTWGQEAFDLPGFIFLASALGVVQVMVSVVSLVKSWPEELEYANESSYANMKLADDFKVLAEQAASPPTDLKARADQLLAADQARMQQDSKKHVSEKELRFGHRHGLRQFRRACAGCGEVPTDLNSTKCNVCGDFKWLSIKLLRRSLTAFSN